MSPGEARRALVPPIRRRARRALDTSKLLTACWLKGCALSPLGVPDASPARNEFGSYCVPRATRHRPASRAIIEGRVWEHDTLEFARAVDPSGDIVHAGTFFGDFIPALARSRGEGALVWAFEPNRESYRCARVTAKLNGLRNVRLTHAALGAESANALLATSNAAGMASGGGSHIVADANQLAERQRHEQVDVVAIDEVLGQDRQVAMIQLDVEGHEQLALSGAMATIVRCRPLIVLESLPAPDWIAEHLAPLGYEQSASIDANEVLSCATPRS